MKKQASIVICILVVGMFLQSCGTTDDPLLPQEAQGPQLAVSPMANASMGIACVQVHLDIHPTSCPNPLNPKSNGKIPVAILGTENFDVRDIDVSSLLLFGVPPVKDGLEDVATPLDAAKTGCDCNELGPDGNLDLTLKFDTQEIVAAIVAAVGPIYPGQVGPLTITGQLLDGTDIEGSDCMVVVGGKKVTASAK